MRGLVLETVADLVDAIRRVYSDAPLPRPFRLLEIITGSATESEGVVRVQKSRLHALRQAPDPILEALGCELVVARADQALARSRRIIGQLLLGQIAERAFEKIYKTTMGTDDLHLEDDTKTRNETDYRVVNGHQRPVFRINIKFHGTLFRNATDLVKLEPTDCFALATYKIYQGLQKQEREVLPYLFAIVGVPGLTGAAVGAAIPEDLAHLGAVVQSARKLQGKRGVEEAIVAYLSQHSADGPFRTMVLDLISQIESAEWRIISARKADQLLRNMLFERVYAVRVRSFARNYRNAELDMHFSISQDLTRLAEFLSLIKNTGLHGVTGHLERGLV
jgi:hypothetical protein